MKGWFPRRRRLGLTLLGWLALAFGLPAAAAPLVANLNGNFWAWREAGGWTRLTARGHNGPGVFSPDGRSLAYASVAAHAVDAPPPGGETWRTTNIWRLDLAIFRATRLTAQPAGARGGGGRIRSTPAWSPDGRLLAWTELEAGAPRGRQTLVVRGVATGRTRVVQTAVPDYPTPGPPPAVLWSAYGLLTIGPTPTEPTNVFVFDPGGRVVRQCPVYGVPRYLARAGATTFLTDAFSTTLYRLDGRPSADKRPGERLPTAFCPAGRPYRSRCASPCVSWP